MSLTYHKISTHIKQQVQPTLFVASNALSALMNHNSSSVHPSIVEDNRDRLNSAIAELNSVAAALRDRLVSAETALDELQQCARFAERLIVSRKNDMQTP